MVKVGLTSCLTVSHEKSGRANGGRPCGIPPKRVPIVSTGSWKYHDTRVSVISATIGAGTRLFSLMVLRMPGRLMAAWIGERSPQSRGHSSSAEDARAIPVKTHRG